MENQRIRLTKKMLKSVKSWLKMLLQKHKKTKRHKKFGKSKKGIIQQTNEKSEKELKQYDR